VHTPDAGQTSTQAAFASRNYTIATGGAWSERIEVQGFAPLVWADPQGNQVGTGFMVTDDASRTVTIALPEAQFGTPGPGWAFSVVLTGQDGFGPDQARGFAPTPPPFLFGVCADGGTSPICSLDPGSVPKAMDVITPRGTSQATELDPTQGRVVIRPVQVL
jgi:glucoamylase